MKKFFHGDDTKRKSYIREKVFSFDRRVTKSSKGDGANLEKKKKNRNSLTNGDANNHHSHSHLSGLTEESDHNRISRFEELSSSYDKKVNWDEFFTGISFLRWRLLGYAQKGTILEIAAGTGRNLPSYHYRYLQDPEKINRIVLVDKAPSMLEQSKNKWSGIIEGKWTSLSHYLLSHFYQLFYGVSTTKLPAEFYAQDAQDLGNLFPPNSFDTVVDTFGLCSFHDPISVLKELRKICKNDGKILLLEHGIGKPKWMQDYQQRNLSKHVVNWGCYFNKDIEQIVKDSGLQIDLIKRYHFGTTYFIIASPKKDVL